jgi:hypothetical protein
MKKRTQLEEKVLRNRKTGIANALKNIKTGFI